MCTAFDKLALRGLDKLELSQTSACASRAPHKAHAYGRHAFGDQYRATDLLIKEPGKLELVFTPSGGGSPERHEVHEFDGAGVALGMCALPLCCSWSCSFNIGSLESNGASAALGVCPSPLVSPAPLYTHISLPLAHMTSRIVWGGLGDHTASLICPQCEGMECTAGSGRSMACAWDCAGTIRRSQSKASPNLASSTRSQSSGAPPGRWHPAYPDF